MTPPTYEEATIADAASPERNAARIDELIGQLPLAARLGFRRFVEGLELDPDFQRILNENRQVQAAVEQVLTWEGIGVRAFFAEVTSREHSPGPEAVHQIPELVYDEIPSATPAERTRLVRRVLEILGF